MAGVTHRRYADGCWRIWYIDRHGEQRFAKGTPSRRESYQWALALETRERAIRLGIIPEPSLAEVHRDDPIEEVIEQHLAWGQAQGGLRRRPWSTEYANHKHSYLAFWVEQLQLKTLGDLQGRLVDVEVISRQLQEERTNKTVNDYLITLTSFCSWCIGREYFSRHPLQALQLLNDEPEVKRRALTVDEIGRLLDCAPPERRILYETVLLTGLRANEARQLTLDHLDLENDAILLDAKWTKGRRDTLQPLPRWFLQRLQAYGGQKIAGTLYKKHRSKRLSVPATNPLFFVPEHTADAINADLKKTGIEKNTPQGKVDFHALRTTFATLLDEVGATEKTKEVLMRHQPANLTSKRYVKSRKERLEDTVDKVANLLGLTDLYADDMPETP